VSLALGCVDGLTCRYVLETRRVNKEGSLVRYRLARNERHLRTGSKDTKVIHNFGRGQLGGPVGAGPRLVASISRLASQIL
jgi:hypothetical protein